MHDPFPPKAFAPRHRGIVVPAVARLAGAQAYPSRPVRFVVGFAAGGTTDIGARLIGHWLQERLGQPFVIENRPGAGTNIATETVVRARRRRLHAADDRPVGDHQCDALRQAQLRISCGTSRRSRASTAQPQVMVVNPSLPAKTVPDLIAYAKANPGKINYGVGGTGSFGHLAGELFKMLAGVDMLHVPYRGAGPALTDLLGGQVLIARHRIDRRDRVRRSGELRALAVTTAARAGSAARGADRGRVRPGYEAERLLGSCAPKNTPAEIVEPANREIGAALADPRLQARFADLGGTTLTLAPAEFGKLLAGETEKWAKVIRAANIKPE